MLIRAFYDLIQLTKMQTLTICFQKVLFTDSLLLLLGNNSYITSYKLGSLISLNPAPSTLPLFYDVSFVSTSENNIVTYSSGNRITILLKDRNHNLLISLYELDRPVH